MMKKNLSVAVVLAVLLTLAVGYALFSQTINITGTATAQGSFNFSIECSTGLNSGISDNLSTIISNYNSLLTSQGVELIPTTVAGNDSSSCSTSGNTATMQTNLQYPGALQIFTVKVTNTGSISGKIDMANQSSNSSATVLNGNAIAVYVNNSNIIPASTSGLESFENTLSNHEFVPNESFYVVYAFYWPTSSTAACSNDTTADNYCYVNLTDSFLFVQYN